MSQQSIISALTADEAGGAPSLITSNLVLHLDAGDSGSYPGTGTTWTDLSPSGNDFTLSGSPTWSSAEGGHFVFDGTDDYASGTDTDFPINAEACTMSVWCTNETETSSWGMALAYGTDGQDLCRALGVDPTEHPVAAHYGSDIADTSTFTVGAWTNLVSVYDGTDIEFYVNATSIGTLTVTLAVALNLAYVGQQINAFSEFWNGKISHCLIYDVALSAAQVQQNYDAISVRY